MVVQFKKAERTQSRLRMALIGPSGSGKTMTALKVARGVAGEAGKIALIDTERGSASKYSDETDFDALELDDFAPKRYIEAIEAAAAGGYDVLIIDSLTHAWSGRGGILEMVDKAKRNDRNNNAFGAWKDATPLHNRLLDSMLGSPCHVIATMRSKTDYAQVPDPQREGKTKIEKVGIGAIQRDGVEFEFDIIGELDSDNLLTITKTRYSPLRGYSEHMAGQPLGGKIRGWLVEGRPLPLPWTPNELGEALRGAGLVSADLEYAIGHATPKEHVVDIVNTWMEEHPGQRVGQLVQLAKDAKAAKDAPKPEPPVVNLASSPPEEQPTPAPEPEPERPEEKARASSRQRLATVGSD